MKAWIFILASALASPLSLLLSFPLYAQPYPAKSIRMIVPFTPGGGTDILARSLGQKLGESMGTAIVIENKPGAGGNFGAELAAKAPADGYTLLMVSASYAVNAALYPLGFDPVKDLLPISQIATVPFVLMAHPSLAANDVQELIALARAQPGRLNYASSGTGSSPHLAGELLALLTGTTMVHVPYKGGAPALADLLGGQVQLLFATVVQGLPHIKSGKLKPLAVGGRERSKALPQVPTIAESGVPEFELTNWFGVLAPAGTPLPILERLNREIVQQLHAPELRARLAAEGAEPAGTSGADFERLIRADIEKFGRIVKAAGIRVQ
jgi:tripartite-type tricarboxylate transporter receptor subunit TctC